MTRETKLGLLIGTGIILLIGIVVSDHLSAVGRHDTPPTPNYADNSSNLPQPPMLLSGDTQGAGNSAPGAVPGAVPGAANAGAGANQAVPGGPAPMRGTPAPLPDGNGLADGGDPAPAMSLSDSQWRLGQDASHPARSGALESDRGGSPMGLFDPPPANVLDNRTTDIGPIGNRTTVSSTVVHQVKAGETLWQIAKQYYGDGSKWSQIVAANKAVLSGRGGLREGLKLTIPNAATATDTSLLLPDDSAGRTAQGPTSTGGKTVTVQAGDTLGKIAARALGSAKYWPQLLKANTDQLKSDKQMLKVGMVLKLPDASGKTTGSSGGITAQAPKSKPGQTADAGGKFYVVQQGDSLYTIAKKTLGNANHWKDILAANKTTLNGKAALQVGQKLVIPGNTGHNGTDVTTTTTPAPGNTPTAAPDSPGSRMISTTIGRPGTPVQVGTPGSGPASGNAAGVSTPAGANGGTMLLLDDPAPSTGRSDHPTL